MFGVSANTLSRWNTQGKWNEQRRARMLSPDKLIAHYYAQSEKIIEFAQDKDRPLNAGEADALNKLATAIQKLDKKIDASLTMSVLKNFINYLLQLDPELAKQVVEYHVSYVQTLLDAQK